MIPSPADRDPYIRIPPDSEILHTQRGLVIRRNKINKFTVASLLFYADPEKDSPTWLAEAQAGLTDAQFRKEYLLDYCALFGERVFPEITAYADTILLRGSPPTFPASQSFFAGFDYGSHAPSSFHVYTILDGIVYCIWELYEPCKNIATFAAKIHECPWWSSISYVAADPSMWASTQQITSGNITSLYQLFVESGIYNLVRGIRDESTWVAKIKSHWSSPDSITFCIYSDACPAIVREFETAIYASPTASRYAGDSLTDDIATKHNHALDDCKYAFNSQPAERQSTRREIRWPSMVDRWAKPTGKRGTPKNFPHGSLI